MIFIRSLTIPLCLLATLAGCYSTDWSQVQKDEWYDAPDETSEFVRGTEALSPVILSELPRAIDQLRDMAFVEIDHATARRITMHEFETAKVLLLVRGVQFSSNTEGFATYWKGTDLWLHHGALSSSLTMEKAPVVVALDQVPSRILVSCSVAR